METWARAWRSTNKSKQTVLSIIIGVVVAIDAVVVVVVVVVTVLGIAVDIDVVVKIRNERTQNWRQLESKNVPIQTTQIEKVKRDWIKFDSKTKSIQVYKEDFYLPYSVSSGLGGSCRFWWPQSPKMSTYINNNNFNCTLATTITVIGH